MTFLLALLAPGMAWYLAGVFLILAVGERWRPHRAWCALGVGLALGSALEGLGGWLAVPAIGAWAYLAWGVVRARKAASRWSFLPMADHPVAGPKARVVGGPLLDMRSVGALLEAAPHEVAEALRQAIAGRATLSKDIVTLGAVTFAGAAVLVVPRALGPAAPGDGWMLDTLARALVGAMGGVAAVEQLPASWLRPRFALAAAVPILARLALAFRLDGVALVEATARIQAVPLVYDTLALRADPSVLAALVRAVPARDEAALALGWSAALAAGWNPQHARGVEVPVARALEAAGRGEEALHLLSNLPREGEIDWVLALVERTQGKPVGWLGGRVPGPIVPGVVRAPGEVPPEGSLRVEFTALAPLSTVRVRGGAGACTLELRLDGQPWKVGSGDADLGPADVGPHRVEARRVGGGTPTAGAAGCAVTSVEGEAS